VRWTQVSREAELQENAVDQLEFALTGILGEPGHEPSSAVRAVAARHVRTMLDPGAGSSGTRRSTSCPEVVRRVG